MIGVPYAQPPVGTLRWSVPMPLVPPPKGTCWPGVYNATSFAEWCMQLGDPWFGSEDCLVSYSCSRDLSIYLSDRKSVV